MKRLAVSLFAITAAVAFTSAPMSAQAPSRGPQPVGVIELDLEDVPRTYTLPGRAIASEEADIRPQVSGLLTEVLYTPGQPIEQGAPMFRIESSAYEARVAQAEADLSSARAALSQAEADFERRQSLIGSATTQAALDEARATYEQAQAAVQAAESALELAQIELSWTTIRSPIAGMASVPLASVGDLVAAGQAEALATVTRLDPIEVDMYEPSGAILEIREDIEAGRLDLFDELQTQLTLPNGTVYSATGELIAPGYTVSVSTGTIDARFRFENPQNRLLPGMFVRGQVALGTTEALLVPQTAAIRGRDGRLTAWVVEDGKAARRALTEDGTFESNWIVTDGLEPGDMLIVDGTSGLAPEAEVDPVPVLIDDEGVVRNLSENPPEGADAVPQSDAEAAE